MDILAYTGDCVTCLATLVGTDQSSETDVSSIYHHFGCNTLNPVCANEKCVCTTAEDECDIRYNNRCTASGKGNLPVGELGGECTCGNLPEGTGISCDSSSTIPRCFTSDGSELTDPGDVNKNDVSCQVCNYFTSL